VAFRLKMAYFTLAGDFNMALQKGLRETGIKNKV